MSHPGAGRRQICVHDSGLEFGVLKIEPILALSGTNLPFHPDTGWDVDDDVRSGSEPPCRRLIEQLGGFRVMPRPATW